MKITVKLPKPRNPLAVLARQRKAGSHRDRPTRQSQKRDLRRELAKQ